MRSLLALLIVTLALAALCCCEKDSKEPSGSPSADSIKIKKEVANAFVKRNKRSSPYEWYFESYRRPMEQMHERCENYPPCDYLSDQIGFALAYNRFFGRY
ncbi:osteocalcin [Corvus cornix cornix]|nr:PREDICTED: osteocalcin [Corvus brachyrhynchos]XP_010409026.1 osteocalcin [Corvus cornix cornix]XP_031963163.1 osteocalcin-like [Corvus moneduloides]XP_041883088.1 osteocalcin-like [Corvus kubaryi]XP_048158500.1 osteocalcin-like [Corvus hawaiiensis]